MASPGFAAPPGPQMPPQFFGYIPEANIHPPTFEFQDDKGIRWLAYPPQAQISTSSASRPRKRSKKHSKKKSKSSKRPREENALAAYFLQVLGLICLVLAAIKSFEPLTGVGFVLILIGHDRKFRKSYLKRWRTTLGHDDKITKRDRKDKDHEKKRKKIEEAVEAECDDSE